MEEEKENEAFEERRKYVRLQANVGVEYTVIGRPGEVRVFSKDISAGGLCLLMEKEMPIDTPLQLQIKIPDLKDPIPALGRVVWQKKLEQGGEEPKVYFYTGIEFTGISDFDRFNINRYVMEHVDLQK